MTETLYAIIDADGLIVDRIVADAEFVKALPDMIADEDVDSGNLDPSHRYVDITDRDPMPGIGWTRGRNGRFTPPPEPELDEPAVPVDELVVADPLLADLSKSQKAAVGAAVREALARS